MALIIWIFPAGNFSSRTGSYKKQEHTQNQKYRSDELGSNIISPEWWRHAPSVPGLFPLEY